MLSTCETQVYIADQSGAWILLDGYVGGLSLGITSSAVQLDGDVDGIPKFIKGNSAGTTSAIAIRTIAGDEGQNLILRLCSHDDDGLGFVKIVKPQGGAFTANGIFLSAVGNVWDGQAYQGYTVTFTQIDPEIEI